MDNDPKNIRLKDLESRDLQVNEFGLFYKTITGLYVYIDGLAMVDENVICTYTHFL